MTRANIIQLLCCNNCSETVRPPGRDFGKLSLRESDSVQFTDGSYVIM